MDDSAIVAAVLNGDRDRFGEVVQRYQGMVYGLAWHILGRHADAQDVAQQAFVSAYARLHLLNDPRCLAGWLRRITTNSCRMLLRAAGPSILPWGEIENDSPSLEASPLEHSLQSETRQRVHEAVGALPEPQRLAVTLFYMGGMSCEDVARFLNVSVGTVRVRLHRARRTLKEALTDMVEHSMEEQRPGSEFTEAVRRSLPVRVVEPIDLSHPTRPDDTVLVCAYGASLRIAGCEGSDLRVTGHRILFGITAEEAHARGKQAIVSVARRSDLWEAGPLQGDLWNGVNHEKTGLTPSYRDATAVWQELRRSLDREPKLAACLTGAISAEVVTATATVGRADGVFVPCPFDREAMQGFYANCVNHTDGVHGEAFGPAANVEVTVHVPPCAQVIVVGAATVTVEGLHANLVLLGGDFDVVLRDLYGDAQCFGTTPASVVGISGELCIIDWKDHRGAQWSGGAIRRCGDIRGMKVRDVGGSVDIRCRYVNADVAGTNGDLTIANDFGRTAVTLDDAWPADRTVDLSSESGPVTLRLTRSLDERVRIGAWTENGIIDYRRWRTPGKDDVSVYNDLETMYLATNQEHEDKDIRIHTRSGAIRLVRR